MYITFTKDNKFNHYKGTGSMGTQYHYELCEDGKWYTGVDGTEWDSEQEVQEHLCKRDKCEWDAFQMVATLRVKAFWHNGEIYNNVRDKWAGAEYIYCKDAESAKDFCEWCGLMADTYQLDRATKWVEHCGGYLYHNLRGEWVEMDEALGAIIYNLLARD